MIVTVMVKVKDIVKQPPDIEVMAWSKVDIVKKPPEIEAMVMVSLVVMVMVPAGLWRPSVPPAWPASLLSVPLYSFLQRPLPHRPNRKNGSNSFMGYKLCIMIILQPQPHPREKL